MRRNKPFRNQSLADLALRANDSEVVMQGMDRETMAETPIPGGTVLRGLIARRDETRAPEVTAIQRLSEKDHERAVATALGRAAERTQSLPVYVERVRFSSMTVAEMPEYLPERALLAIAEDNRGKIGFVALCQNLLASMVEMQALGRVTPRPAQPRRPTRTDAAISAEFVNALLDELGRELAAHPGLPRFGSFRYVAYLDDPRPLSLMLEDGAMARLSLDFRIGTGGKRDGAILIGLPEMHVRTEMPPSALLPVASSPAPPPETIEPTLAEAVREAPVTLSGVLCRRTMTLRALRGLQAGGLIPLPGNALDDVRVETMAGQLLARGRLGENEGFHAIKLRPAGIDTPEGDTAREPLSAAGFSGIELGAPPIDLDMPDPFRNPDRNDLPPALPLRAAEG